jgi:hypothetical protein
MPADGIMDTGDQNTTSGLLRNRGEISPTRQSCSIRSQCFQPSAPGGHFNGVQFSGAGGEAA